MFKVKSKYSISNVILILIIGDYYVCALAGNWAKIFSDSTAIEDELNVSKEQSMPHLVLPNLYEEWTRMFRNAYQYQSRNFQRKAMERNLIEKLNNYQHYLNTELLSLMQQLKFDRMAIINDDNNNRPKFNIDMKRFENLRNDQMDDENQLTNEEYIRWLYELYQSSQQFKEQIMI